METTGLDGLKKYLFGKSTRQMVYKGLDAATTRSRAIAQNLANVTTPGYNRKEVRFEEALRDALHVKINGKQTDIDHTEISKRAMIQKIRPEVYEANDPTLPGEINNVDVDLEASKMAENQIMYNYLTRFAGFDKITSAIKGSGS